MIDLPTAMTIAGAAAANKDFVLAIYGDLAKPGVQQAGKGIGELLELGLLPVHWANQRARIFIEANLERYRQKMEAIPMDKVVPVPPEVGVPILEQMTYVQDPTLAELLAQLLASASNTDTQATAHPSFANIIRNLSPDEAKLIPYFKGHGGIPFVSVSSSNGAIQLSIEKHAIAIPPVNLFFPNNLQAYLSNMIGLGLVETRKDVLLAPLDHYYVALEDEVRTRLKSHSFLATHPHLILERGRMDNTPFGWMFFKASTGPEISLWNSPIVTSPQQGS